MSDASDPRFALINHPAFTADLVEKLAPLSSKQLTAVIVEMKKRLGLPSVWIVYNLYHKIFVFTCPAEGKQDIGLGDVRRKFSVGFDKSGWVEIISDDRSEYCGQSGRWVEMGERRSYRVVLDEWSWTQQEFGSFSSIKIAAFSSLAAAEKWVEESEKKL